MHFADRQPAELRARDDHDQPHPFTGTAAPSPFSEPSPSTATAKAAPVPRRCLSWTQSASRRRAKGRRHIDIQFNLARNDGQQYLAKTKVVLPPGLVGKIPAVAQCTEALATAGNCPANSKVGTVPVTAGSGPSPYPFPGNVYLTGP